MSKSGQNLRFKYNAAGLRTEKTYNGTTTTYHWVGDKVTRETNGTEYYYVRNGQGDITGILNGAGTQVVTSVYDAWGKLVSTTDNSGQNVATKNPYRYRGYRYDTETGLYYLQSRYYNPDWGRFLNADVSEVLQLIQGDVLSHNLFVYCMNNPVNNTDESGYLSSRNKWIIGGMVLAAVVVVVVIVATGGTTSPLLLALKGEVSSLKIVASSLATATRKASSDIWRNIRATQPLMQGTNIPQSFELTVGKVKFWVHENATRHMLEFVKYAASRLGGHSQLAENELMQSFYDAVSVAVKNGIQYEKIMNVNGWELIFSLPRDLGLLPVIKHALFKN